MSRPDRLHYVRIPNGFGARAEQVRMAYALAGKPYVDVLCTFAEAPAAVAGRNPFKQFPFVETPSGEVVYQTLAIMHHVGRGTPVWPDDPAALTRALEVGVAAYDLYQFFGAFAADDATAKKKFEERRAPQFFGGLAEIYGQRQFATGDAASFADCMAHQAVAWCVRRNDVCRGLFERSPVLVAFQGRFEQLPAIAALMARQAAARQADNSV
jgi:glutathione S-transferase